MALDLMVCTLVIENWKCDTFLPSVLMQLSLAVPTTNVVGLIVILFLVLSLPASDLLRRSVGITLVCCSMILSWRVGFKAFSR